jgi:hypothetical protein
MVHNPGYSSIEDAWGSLNPMTQKKKKKKTKDVMCDLYELGNNNGNYDELEMVRAANYNKSRYQKDRAASREGTKYVNIDAADMVAAGDELAPVFDKDSIIETQFMTAAHEAQCSNRPTPLPEFKTHFTDDYESLFRPLMSNDEVEEDPNEYQEFKNILQKHSGPAPAPAQSSTKIISAGGYEKPGDRMYFEEEFIEPRASSRVIETGFLDILLYIISGVILIFMMEQFVKIGMMLQ